MPSDLLPFLPNFYLIIKNDHFYWLLTHDWFGRCFYPSLRCGLDDTHGKSGLGVSCCPVSADMSRLLAPADLET